MPTSIAMAFTEYATIALIVKTGYSVPLVVGAGIGAGIGCLAAMKLHGRYVKTKKQSTEGART
jgi:thiazole synthase ThiGH ThiG subunit